MASTLAMLLPTAVLLLSSTQTAAAVAAAPPSAACQAVADAWCSNSSAAGGCPLTKKGQCAGGQEMFARKGGPGAVEWNTSMLRC